MFIKIIKHGFSRWWDKMGYAVLTSFLSAINPFFLATMVFILLGLLIEDKSVLIENIRLILMVLPPVVLATAVFPTTFAGIAVQKQVAENETMYFKRYFPDYFKLLWKFLPKSLLLSLIYIAVGFLLSYSAIFYFSVIENIVFRGIAVLVVIWVYLFLLLSRFILIPLIIYNPEMKLSDAIKISFKIVLAEGLAILGIVIIDFLVWVALTMTRFFFLFIYYGLSANLRIFTHKEIIAKYTKKDETDNKEKDSDTREAWAGIMKKMRENSDSSGNMEDTGNETKK
jgi:hypothetical protein